LIKRAIVCELSESIWWLLFETYIQLVISESASEDLPKTQHSVEMNLYTYEFRCVKINVK